MGKTSQKPKKKKKVKFLPYLLIAPTLILFGAFTYYPLIKAIVLSFYATNKKGIATKFVGIANWTRFFTKSSSWSIIGVTMKIAAINLVFTFTIAFIFALLAMKKAKGCKVYQTMYALPMAIASAPAAAVFMFIFRQHNGILNTILGGKNIPWLTSMPYALATVCTMTTWMNVGISFIFLLVGFRNVSDDLLESAMIDGAGPLRRIWNIIIPISSPQIFFVLFLNIINSFKGFAQIKLLTGGGPGNATKTLIYHVYENAIVNGRFETACVQALVLFAIIFFFTSIQRALENRMVHYQ